MNQRYDSWSCKSKAERRRRRAREKIQTEDGETFGLFATLTNPSLEDLIDLNKAYALTKSALPSRLIGSLPNTQGFNIVPEYGTDNHMFLPQ